MGVKRNKPRKKPRTPPVVVHATPDPSTGLTPCCGYRSGELRRIYPNDRFVIADDPKYSEPNCRRSAVA